MIPEPHFNGEAMVVYTKAQLAAAIRAVPHESPSSIILRRSNGETIFRFDYTAETMQKHADAHQGRGPGLDYCRKLLPVKHHQEAFIDQRLARLASRVLRLPSEAFK